MIKRFLSFLFIFIATAVSAQP
ncbi:MAG: hypothetical protein JWO32_3066, partial [Bacteroidetes bacterium]|nr:hypothetical protein [Bacteroidota bacterium]